MDFSRRLEGTFAETFEIYGHQIDAGVRVGTALAPDDGKDVDQLINRAVQTLHRRTQ